MIEERRGKERKEQKKTEKGVMLKIKGDSYGSTNLTLSPSGIKLFNLNCPNPSLNLESPKALSIN